MAGIFVPIVADASRLIRSFRQAGDAADLMGRDLKQLGLTAEQSARKQVEAATRRDARLRSEIVAYRQIASAAARGSREQVVAANAAVAAEQRLARSLGVTSAEARMHARSVAGAEREVSRFGRGALAGSGLVRGLGRSLAFASGGFIAFAGLSELIRGSIDAATEAAATERQLGAQFRAAGQDVDEYRGRIKEAALATSQLSGFTEDDLTRSFTTAFRASGNVDTGLTIMRVAADAARGSHKDLTAVTLGLTRAWGGAATSLRRLGILIPKNVTGMDAITFVARKFAGQALAGTTAQQRFAAAIHNTEISIGAGFYPQLTRVLNKGTEWLSQQHNQEAIQRDVTSAVKTGTAVVQGFGEALGVARDVLEPFVAALGGAKNAARDLAIVLLLVKLRGYAAAVGLKVAGEAAVVAEGEMAGAAGAAATLKTNLLGLARVGAIVVGVDLITHSKKIIDEKGKSLGQRLGELVEQGFSPLGVQRKVVEALAGKKVATVVQRGTEAWLTLGLSEAWRHFWGQHKVQHVRIVFDLGRADFQPGRGPGGPGAFPVPGSATVPGPLGFKAKFADLELKLAQAQLTKTQADDRKALQLEAALLRERVKTLGTARKTLAERTQLTQQLVGIEQQIAAIDEQGRKATLTAEQRRLKAQAGRLADEKKAADAELRNLKKRERDLKSQIKSITSAFAQAVDAARSGIGDLFGGPVLNFSDERRKAALGIPNQASDPAAAARDIRAQNREFVQRQRLIRQIVRRAPRNLRGAVTSDIENLGLTQLRAIGGMTPRQFAALLARERLASQTARVAMRAQLVTLHADRVQLRGVQRQEVKVEVEIKGLAKDQARVKVKQSSAQRRGDHPGKS